VKARPSGQALKFVMSETDWKEDYDLALCALLPKMDLIIIIIFMEKN
jgi:hypothetical protein